MMRILLIAIVLFNTAWMGSAFPPSVTMVLVAAQLGLGHAWLWRRRRRRAAR